MSGTLVKWPPPASGSSGGGGGITTVGSMDAQSASVNGATISGTTIYMQSAGVNNTGLVNISAQTFGGAKTFNVQTLFADGSQSAPGIAFSNETTSGLYRVGVEHIALGVGNFNAIDIIGSGNAYANIGLGGGASLSPNFPLYVNRTIAGTIQLQLNNPDIGAGSGSKIQAQADNGNNLLELSAFTAATIAPDIYAGGRGIVRATGALTGITLVADSTANSDIRFYPGGDNLANRVVTIGSAGLVATQSIWAPALVIGSTTVTASASAGTYTITLPGSQGSALQAPLNDGSGRLSWQFINLASGGVVGSLSLTSQVVGNLPLSQTQGSLSLTSQVVGNLPLSQTQGSLSLTSQVVGNLPLSQTQGSLSLSSQISGILPQANLTLTPTFTQATIGSISVTSSTGGAAYTIKFPGQSASSISFLSNDGFGNLSWKRSYPTVQTISSSGTYSTPTGATWIRVRMVGGGAGGSGTGVGAAEGGNGGNTIFGSTFLQANGGGGSSGSVVNGGQGGTATLGSFAFGFAIAGGDGEGYDNIFSGQGGQGGASFFGGLGPGGQTSANGGAAKNNTGSGGGGGGGTASITSSGGGGAGGYLDAIVINPAASYTYSVGQGGAGGAAGTNGLAGGQGGSGIIIIEEHYI